MPTSKRRMGIGFHRPVEIHYESPQASPSSIQVEASSSQVETAPIMEANDAPPQEQVQDPPHVDQVAMQEPSSPIVDASQGHDQDQPSPSIVEDVLQDDQGQHSGQDGDSNDQDDQEIPPRCNRDIETRRKARVEKDFKIKSHRLENILGDHKRGVTTRRQLASFSEQIGRASCRERV